MACAISNECESHMCRVCLNRFTKPKLLSCFHTYCEGCLPILEKIVCRYCDEYFVEDDETDKCKNCSRHLMHHQKTYVCSICSAETKVDAKLHDNFIIQHRMDSEDALDEVTSSNAMCGDCEKQVAICFCVECEQKLCEKCGFQDHKVKRRLRDHQLIDLKDVKEKHLSKSSSQKVCPEHQRVMELYCQTCKVVICHFCSLVEIHKGHKLTTIEDIYETQQRQLLGLIDNAEVGMVEICESVKKAENEEAQLLKEKQDSIYVINKELEKIIEMVKVKQSELVAIVSQNFNDNIDCIDNTRRKANRLEHLINFSKSVNSDADDCDFVNIVETLNSELNNYLRYRSSPNIELNSLIVRIKDFPKIKETVNECRINRRWSGGCFSTKRKKYIF